MLEGSASAIHKENGSKSHPSLKRICKSFFFTDMFFHIENSVGYTKIKLWELYYESLSRLQDTRPIYKSKLHFYVPTIKNWKLKFNKAVYVAIA